MSQDKYGKAINLLKSLVSIPSPSGKETEAGEFIKDYIESLGISPILHEVYKGGYNIIAEVGTGSKSILIESHIDVVPKLDMEDPFKPRIDGDKLYGRGACDTKGGLVSTLLALEDLIKYESQLDKRIIFAYTVDEEMYGRGAKELLIRGVNAEYGIVIEPTNLEVAISIPGCIEFRIESIGLSGHGALSDAGKNAIYPLCSLIESLVSNNFFKVSGDLPHMKNTINIGKIYGGESPWMTPSSAYVEGLIHFIPTYTFDYVYNWLSKFVEDEEKRLDAVFHLEYTHGCEGYILDKSDPFIKHLGLTSAKVLGNPEPYSHFPSESDANELYLKGGIKSVVFGPGEISVAHSSIEHIKISDVIKASDFLVEALITF